MDPTVGANEELSQRRKQSLLSPIDSNDLLSFLPLRQVVRFTLDTLQTLIEGQVVKKFYPLPGVAHI
jgi:hypothetical protein